MKQRLNEYLRQRFSDFRTEEIIDSLRCFVPNSTGDANAKAKQALLAAHQVFPFILEAMKQADVALIEPRPIAAVCNDISSARAAAELAVLFNAYGSDKSSYHDYQLLYGWLLHNKRQDKLTILEIGLGTNNPRIVSTMGAAGKPGASLRAFRDFLNKSQIIGADIDRDILFQEDRISTCFVDQTDAESFKNIPVGDQSVDLLIDDGLHNPNANLATLIFALRKLKVGGWLVVEDIGEESLPIWMLIASLLNRRYPSFDSYCTAGHLVHAPQIHELGSRDRMIR